MIRKIILTLAVSLNFSALLMAQNSFLAMPNDATSAALAGANGAYSPTNMAAGGNMAASVIGEDVANVGLNYMSLQPQYLNTSIMGGGGYYKLSDQLSLGAAFSFESGLEQEVINSAGVVDGTFSPYGMITEVGVGYALSEKLSVGLSARYIYSDIYTITDMAYGANLSATYKHESSSVALIATGLGTQGESIVTQPLSIEVAGSHKIEINPSQSLGVMATVGYIAAPASIASLKAAGAAEWSFESRYFVRAGYSYSDEDIYSPCYTSLGAGAAVGALRLDAAYLIGQSNNPLNGSFMVGLTWRK